MKIELQVERLYSEVIFTISALHQLWRNVPPALSTGHGLRPGSNSGETNQNDWRNQPKTNQNCRNEPEQLAQPTKNQPKLPQRTRTTGATNQKPTKTKATNQNNWRNQPKTNQN